MSLKISSVPIDARGAGGKNSIKVSSSDTKSIKKTDEQIVASRSNSGVSNLTQEQLRYEVSSLSRKSVDLQKAVSERQSTSDVLDEFDRLLSELRKKPSTHSLSRIRAHVEDNSEVYRGQSNASSNDKIEPITVSRPPKVGSYSVAIFTGQSRHPEAVSYTIKLVDEEDTQKTVTASVSPLSGLIEGVELYFETDNDTMPVLAELSIKEEESKRIEVPTFNKDLERLEATLNDSTEFEKLFKQTSHKLDSVRKGVHDDLKKAREQFIILSSTQENLRATDTDPHSVSTAFVALDDLKTEIKSFSGADRLFSNHDLTQAKSLLD